MNESVRGQNLANKKEIRDTLSTLATALSVTADSPTDGELRDANNGSEFSDRELYRILVTFSRVLSALKVREDAS